MNILKSLTYGALAGLAMSGVWQIQEVNPLGGSIIGVGVLIGAVAIFIDSQTREGK
jgi:hypothetical protein